jgi:hypothetical protein
VSALGIHLTVVLARALKRRKGARDLIANSINFSQANQTDGRTKILAAANNFLNNYLDVVNEERIRLCIQHLRESNRLAERQISVHQQNYDSTTTLDYVLKIEKIGGRSEIYLAHSVEQICGQVFRYVVASGLPSAMLLST